MYKFSVEQALIIRGWRENCTWRKIADLASMKWPELEIMPSNQLEGIEICSCAAKILNEKENVEPWC